MALTLLLGGARSGKSSLAVDMGHRVASPVTYIATAPRLDDDMAERIDNHRLERPSDWATLEEEVELESALRSSPGFVIIDCLTLWTSNLMAHEIPDAEIQTRAVALALLCTARPDRVVAISNEVGMGVHPETPLGRRYRDLLGRVNQAFAAVADPALLLVAGRVLPLHDPWDLIAT